MSNELASRTSQFLAQVKKLESYSKEWRKLSKKYLGLNLSTTPLGDALMFTSRLGYLTEKGLQESTSDLINAFSLGVFLGNKGHKLEDFWTNDDKNEEESE